MADKAEKPTSTYKPAPWFWESRKKGPTLPGAVIFTALRLLDIPLQYYLLQSDVLGNLISRFGGTTITSQPLNTVFLDLSPYQALILSLAIGSSAKQIYWRLVICDTVMPVSFSVIVALYNTLLNTINTGLAIWSVTSQQPSQPPTMAMLMSRDAFQVAPPALIVGVPLYILGLFVEWYSELQRKAFKADPANKGKPYAAGLFGLARNINYGGYTLWRAGYSLCCGGWGWAGVVTTWLAGDFCNRAIPSLDVYCAQRYGAQWEEVRRTVPDKLLPGIW